MNRIFFSLLCVLVWQVWFPAPLWADVVTGRAIDAQSGKPLPEAVVEVVVRDEVCTTSSMVYADSLGVFVIPNLSGSRIQLKVSMPGYYSAKRSFMAGEMGDTLRLGDLALKPSDVLLGTAEVNARARRFVIRGDTVVFNPAAFRLDEGARLDELLKKLPGVTQKDGQLYWMERPVRILLEGEEMLADNTLLANTLPAEAVDRIKAYNKQSDLKEMSGNEDGAEDYVLDIRVKPGFLDKWYGDAEASYQTPARYRVQLDAMYLSTHDPLFAMFNWGNNNQIVFNKTYNSMSMGSEQAYGKQLMGAFGYKRQWERKQGAKPLAGYVALSGFAAHTDGWGDTRTTQETFYPGEERTFGLTHRRQYNHKVNPSLDFRGHFEPDTLTKVDIAANAGYTRSEEHGLTRSGVFNADPYTVGSHPIDGIFAPEDSLLYAPLLTTRSRYQSRGETEKKAANGYVKLQRLFRDKSRLLLNAKFSYEHTAEETLTERTIDYFRAGNLRERTAQLGRTPSRSHTAEAYADYSKWFGSKVMLNFRYAFSHVYSRTRSNLYSLHRFPGYAGAALVPEDSLPRLLDAANSYLRTGRERRHAFSLAATLDFKPFSFQPKLDATYRKERMAYRRGVLDTAAVRREWVVEPSLAVRARLSATSALEGSYAYGTEWPELLQTLAFRDDTDPLHVLEGNPLLRNSHTHRAELKYVGNFQKHQQSLIAKAGYSRSIDPVQTVFYYRPSTGGYRSYRENVRGGDEKSFGLSYERALGEFVRLRNDFSLGAARDYGYLTATEGEGLPQLNRTRTLRVVESPELSYEDDKLSLALGGKYDFRRRTHSLSANPNNRLTAYEASLSASYDAGAFKFNTYFLLSGYGGYSMTAMNKPRPVWSASVLYGFRGNKARLLLEVDDILNKQRFYMEEVTPYSRTETEEDYIHHNVRLTFSYHFDAKKTKEGKAREKRRALLNGL